MTEFRIELKEDSNKKYYDFLKEQHHLMDRWNNLMGELQNLKISKLFPWKSKRQIARIWSETSQLQEDFLGWSGKVQQFCLKPDLVFVSGTEAGLGYIHFTAALRDVRNILDSYMVLLVHGYNTRAQEYDHRVDFLIAITGLLLSLVGLGWSFVLPCY